MTWGIFQSAMLVYQRVWVNSTKITKNENNGMCFALPMGLTQNCPKEKHTGYLGYADCIGHYRTIYIYFSVIYEDSNKPWNKDHRLFKGFHRVRWNFQLFSAQINEETPGVFGRPLKRTLAEKTHDVNGNWETGYLVCEYSWVVPGTPNNQFFWIE